MASPICSVEGSSGCAVLRAEPSCLLKVAAAHDLGECTELNRKLDVDAGFFQLLLKNADAIRFGWKSKLHFSNQTAKGFRRREGLVGSSRL